MDNLSQSNGYYPKLFIYVPIPVTDPKTDTYRKTVVAGPMSRTLVLQSTQGVPYGPKARAVFCLMTTHAVKTGTPHIELPTISETMRSLGLAVTGGRKGSIDLVKEQFRRWQGSQIEFREEQPGGGVRAVGFRIVNRYMLDWLLDGQYSLIQNYCELSPDFVSTVRKSGSVVPVPQSIYLSIGEPIRQDVLVWLSRINFTTTKSRPPIPRRNIIEQFGPPDIQSKQWSAFWKKFEHHVDWINQNVWSGKARYEFTKEGFVWKRSPLLVEPGDKKAAYVTVDPENNLERSYLIQPNDPGWIAQESAAIYDTKPRRGQRAGARKKST